MISATHGGFVTAKGFWIHKYWFNFLVQTCPSGFAKSRCVRSQIWKIQMGILNFGWVLDPIISVKVIYIPNSYHISILKSNLKLRFNLGSARWHWSPMIWNKTPYIFFPLLFFNMQFEKFDFFHIFRSQATGREEV